MLKDLDCGIYMCLYVVLRVNMNINTMMMNQQFIGNNWISVVPWFLLVYVVLVFYCHILKIVFDFLVTIFNTGFCVLRWYNFSRGYFVQNQNFALGTLFVCAPQFFYFTLCI